MAAIRVRDSYFIVQAIELCKMVQCIRTVGETDISSGIAVKVENLREDRFPNPSYASVRHIEKIA
jgi:hypothetical protein